MPDKEMMRHDSLRGTQRLGCKDERGSSMSISAHNPLMLEGVHEHRIKRGPVIHRLRLRKMLECGTASLWRHVMGEKPPEPQHVADLDVAKRSNPVTHNSIPLAMPHLTKQHRNLGKLCLFCGI